MGVAVEQRLGRHDHSGRAVAALDGTSVDKRLLQRVRLVGGADALDGLDRAAVRLDGEHTARVDRAPVHDDRAGAAFAKVTALLRARQVRALAQHVQKRLLRLHRERAALAVERQVNRVVVFKHDVLSPVQNLLYVPYRPVSAAPCAAAGLSLTGERASHILLFTRGHILSRAGATALESPFFGMGNSILSILHKIKRLNYVEFIQLLYIMSQSGYQRFFQRSNGASPLVFLHIQKKARDSLRCPVPFSLFAQKTGR